MSVLSHQIQKSCHVAIVCLLCAGMLVACGRTRPAQMPTQTASLPPVAEVSPDEGPPVSRTPQSQNIRQIHERLLKKAQDYFDAQQFPDAIRELTRMLALDPDVDLEGDGHWWLGQSYEHVKDWESAQREYRWLASAPKGQRYQSHSSNRLNEIQVLLEGRKAPPQNTQAIRFALNQLPVAEGFEEGITKMKRDGVTTLLIDLGCKRLVLNQANSQSSEKPSDIGGLQALLRSYATRSHRAGLLMYVGVNLRCLGNWAPSEHQAWRDRTYHIDTKTFQTTKWFDLFHPAYQEFLSRFLLRMCKEGVDGVVLLNDYPLGPVDGVTEIGLKRFEKKFGVTFDSSQVFYQGFEPLRLANVSHGDSTQMGAKTKDRLFWRWAGWKARQRLAILEAVVDRLRAQYPSVQFGLELHPHALTNPVGALVKFAEDAMDATQRPFSFFFVRPEIDRRSTYTEQAVIEKLRRISTKAVLDRLLPVVDGPRRVWVSMPAKGGKRLRSTTAAKDAAPLQHFPNGIGVVHDLRAFS